MSGVEWADPPPTSQAVRRADLPNELRKNPGKWALISRHGSNAGAHQKARRVSGGEGTWSPAGAFEATFDPATGNVYARFVGDKA